MATTVWKGQLTFGLVSVPVRLYRAARKERVRMHYMAPVEAEPLVEEEPVEVREPIGKSSIRAEEPEPAAAPAEEPSVSRVTQTFRSEAEQTPVDRRNLLRGHEVAPDRYVAFTQQELRALRPETSSEMQIVRSVRVQEIDPVYFETSYYVAPDRGGERAYALLYAALKESAYAALAQVAMHGREHVAVIRPGPKGLLAHTLYYQDEVRAEGEFVTALADVQPKELQLAKTFVEAIAAPFAPEEFKDTHREKLEGLIAASAAQSAVASPAAAPQSAPRTADIMEALKKSLENTLKAGQNSPAAPRRGPGKVTEIRTKSRKKQA